jgi:hypothetical protein
MGNTALDEQLGGSDDTTYGAAGIYTLRAPTGFNGCRLYVARPTVSGVILRMPNPSVCSTGAAPIFVIINKGSQALTVTNNGGINIGTIAAGNAWEIWLLLDGFDTWLPIGPFPVSSSGTLNGNRKVFDVTYTASSTTVTRVRNDVARQYGYVGADGPAAVSVTIKPGVVLGGGTPTGASFGTGAWPAGSTMLITLEPGAFIAGRGGAGGRGADTNGAGVGAGGDGGLAMDVRVNAALINNGTIQGGGGGGGGGARRLVNAVQVPGGSGGGGAGADPGAGGGIVNGNSATIGQAGSFTAGGTAGDAGGYVGGAGGAPGALGGNGAPGTAGGGGARGAAGVAITVNTSNGYSLNKIVAGTITGAETTF